jgi:putative oxygen-independent coproporphyrinogen III oxidase
MTQFGIYVHWPFCAAKCPYCDFNSHVREQIDEAQWVRLIGAELQSVAALQDTRPTVGSIFFGGGTPSLMSPAAAASVLAVIGRLWRIQPDAEITLEANPNSVEQDRFHGYRAIGVNRISIGVQSLDDVSLRQLGRRHDSAAARSAIALAMNIFPRVSLDLIYARPGQLLADWERELQQALAFGTEHLSLYQLTIEDGTAFASLQRQGKLEIPDEDTASRHYERTQVLCQEAGLPAYEVSNHARHGGECRHNLLYWRYGDYAGVGPGAHGRLALGGGRFATDSERLPERWASRIAAEGRGFSLQRIENRDAAREHLLMNLRISEGLDLAAFAIRWGLQPSRQSIGELRRMRLVARHGSLISATRRGRLVLNQVVAKLADALQKPEPANAFGAGSRTENPSGPTLRTARPRSAEPSG